MDSFLELCRHRRSIRKYSNKPVEQEKIDYILRCALMSPSSKRTNPWEFVVVRDEEKLRAMVKSRTYGSQMFKKVAPKKDVALDDDDDDELPEEPVRKKPQQKERKEYTGPKVEGENWDD